MGGEGGARLFYYTHRFRISVTVSLLQDSRTAWSPRREVMWPRSRMVLMVGWAEGAKAWRWEGRMRGVGRDIVKSRKRRRRRRRTSRDGGFDSFLEDGEA